MWHANRMDARRSQINPEIRIRLPDYILALAEFAASDCCCLWVGHATGIDCCVMSTMNLLCQTGVSFDALTVCADFEMSYFLRMRSNNTAAIVWGSPKRGEWGYTRVSSCEDGALNDRRSAIYPSTDAYTIAFYENKIYVSILCVTISLNAQRDWQNRLRIWPSDAYLAKCCAHDKLAKRAEYMVKCAAWPNSLTYPCSGQCCNSHIIAAERYGTVCGKLFFRRMKAAFHYSSKLQTWLQTWHPSCVSVSQTRTNLSKTWLQTCAVWSGGCVDCHT